jgi:hypothetical protein
VQRAESSLPGPLLGAPACARDVADGRPGKQIQAASMMTVRVEGVVALKNIGDNVVDRVGCDVARVDAGV